MDQQPKIPTLKDAQKPQVKIKGLGAGLTLFDRLKQFKKKDLAFILAGLGTLFMAPLAEHFMMAPESGDSTLSPGWGGTGGRGSFFGNGGSPYENGNNNIAQGGAIGGAGDIITPLNVRDPSALVMGPGAAQQPPAGSAAPATPPPAAPARNENDYKDALAGAASRAASAAVKKAPLPVPKVALGGSGLRGLGVAGGGSSASGGLGPINSGNLGQAGTGGGGLNLVRSTPGFRGAAGPRGPNSPQGLDGTKKAGQNAGDAFSRSGSALSGLNAAAAEQIPTGGSGFAGNGQGGAGANDKGPGGSGPGGSKSVGESLAFIAAKERMMENLKLEFEKRKLKDPELLLYGIRNDVLKASAGEIGKGLTKMFMCSALGMGCPAPDDEYSCANGTMNKSQMRECGKADKDQVNETTTNCYIFDGTGASFKNGSGVIDPAMRCNASGKKGGAAPSKTEGGVSELNGAIGSVCTKIGSIRSGGGKSDYDAYLQGTVLSAAKNAELARNTLLPGGDAKCGTTPVTGDTASKMLSDAKAKLYAAAAAPGADGKTPAATDALGLIKAGADQVGPDVAKAPAQALVDAAGLVEKAKARITEAETALGKSLDPAAKIGVDEAAFRDVTTEVNKVRTAQSQATDVIASMRRAADNLATGIASIEPLVKGPEKPAGALPDQINLNKASADLALEAAAAPPAASKVALPTVKGDVVKEQTASLSSLTELQAAINKAAQPNATEPDKADVKTKLEAAKAPLTAAQAALKAAATALEPTIRTIEIKGAVGL